MVKPHTSNTHQSRRPSSYFYKNDDKRCAQITSKRERCKKDVKPGGNYCPYHETLREKQILEHAKLIKKRGGKSVPPPSKGIYDYNYYLDEEVEPFDSNSSLVSTNPQIWIGSIDSAHDMAFLQGNNIKSVMNASGMEPTPQARDMYTKLGIDYYTLSDIEKVPYKSHYRVSRYLGDEKFSKNGLTPREFFKFMHKGCQIMNQPGFKFPVLIHCFTEEHQLLTNKGFMFLHQIESYQGDDLLFASYDPETDQIIYETYDLIINPYQTYDMIDMTSPNEYLRWNDESDCYGQSNIPSNNVSLITTTGHKMYAKYTDHSQFEKVEAKELLSDNEQDYIQFLGRARNGIQQNNNNEPSVKVLENTHHLDESVWNLNKSQAISILNQLKNGKDAIYTSSITFRDDVIRLAFHAGYSPTFSYCGTTDYATQIDNWKVTYEDGENAEPYIKQDTDIKKTVYTGRTWCVSVPHGFVIARRAYFDKEKGYVTKASRGIITSNCHAGINRSGSLIAAYLMTKPKPYGYEKTVEMLKKANRRRNLDVLTNQDFKRALKYFPVFMGTPEKIAPATMSRYKQFLNAYERQ